MLWRLCCSIHNNEIYGSDADSLADLDGFRVSRFDADISDREEEVGGKGNADSLGLELRGLSLQHIFVGYQWRGVGIKDRHIRSSIGSSSGGDPDTLAFKMQTGENLR